MKKCLLLFLLFGVVLLATAQRRLVVVDVETLAPVVGANVVSRDSTQTTDSIGHVFVSDSCMTITFSHVNYESRIINLDEVRDTVFMISKLLNLKEVVVFGHGKNRDYSDLQKSLKRDKIEAQLAAADPSVGFRIDLAKIVNAVIPKRWRPGYRKEQRKKRLKEILDNY
jgi:hypothetical protein